MALIWKTSIYSRKFVSFSNSQSPLNFLSMVWLASLHGLVPLFKLAEHYSEILNSTWSFETQYCLYNKGMWRIRPLNYAWISLPMGCDPVEMTACNQLIGPSDFTEMVWIIGKYLEETDTCCHGYSNGCINNLLWQRLWTMVLFVQIDVRARAYVHKGHICCNLFADMMMIGFWKIKPCSTALLRKLKHLQLFFSRQIWNCYELQIWILCGLLP